MLRKRESHSKTNREVPEAVGTGGVTPEEICVVFSVPEKRLAEMDVATGPCVPLPGRKRPLVSVHQQVGPERPDQWSALYVALSGRSDEDALQLVEQHLYGRLSRCSDDFVTVMADANELLVRLGDEDEGRETKNRRRSWPKWPSWTLHGCRRRLGILR
jgi:hypothetical protein